MWGILGGHAEEVIKEGRECEGQFINLLILFLTKYFNEFFLLCRFVFSNLKKIGLNKSKSEKNYIVN